jgi:NAD(P)-dependent dehydrogenase (short-subunit alcohol dehydrogenase family)
MQLVGNVALVTGAAQGIGRATVRALAEAGAFVYSADVAEHDPGAGAQSVRLDVADSAAVDTLVASVERPIQVVVNNAGIYAARERLEIADADWRRTFAVIADGTFHCTRAVVRRLLAERLPGAVVNVSSIAGKRAFPAQADYCAAKAAVLGFTRAAALDLATSDITVNAVCPGTVATPMIERVIVEWAAADGVPEADIRDRIIGQVPIARMQTPQEIAAGIVFLASTGARSITGESLMIDGGQTRD